MSPKTTLHINKPCQQDWIKMTPQEKGRYCSLCNKTVTDFSLWSDKQIIAYLKQSHTEVCGRLQPHQLDRTLDLKKSNGEIPKLKLVFTFLSSFWIGTNVKAQGKITITHKELIARETKRGQIHPKEVSKKDSVSLCGFVKDQRGNAVSGAIISINGIAYGITDSVGYFALSKAIVLRDDSVDIAISALGYATTYLRRPVDYNTKMNVVTDIEIACSAKEYNLGPWLGGTMGEVSITKRSFVDRFISSLKSAFSKK